MSDLRYWRKAEDVPTGVVFRNADEWMSVWLEPDGGPRVLHAVERVPVAYRNVFEPYESADDVEDAVELGPFLEVGADEVSE